MYEPPPILIVITEILYALALFAHHATPNKISENATEPDEFETLTEMIFASGATPKIVVPLPAVIPATCVP